MATLGVRSQVRSVAIPRRRTFFPLGTPSLKLTSESSDTVIPPSVPKRSFAFPERGRTSGGIRESLFFLRLHLVWLTRADKSAILFTVSFPLIIDSATAVNRCRSSNDRLTHTHFLYLQSTYKFFLVPSTSGSCSAHTIARRASRSSTARAPLPRRPGGER